MKKVEFDVYMCYQSSDKEFVLDLGKRLKAEGLQPWLDEWELRPGLPSVPEIEKAIRSVKAGAIFVGPLGIGRWQELQRMSLLRQLVDRGCPVIPVLLPGVEEDVKLPTFLETLTWVDFRDFEPDPFERLLWGISGTLQSSPGQENSAAGNTNSNGPAASGALYRISAPSPNRLRALNAGAAAVFLLTAALWVYLYSPSWLRSSSFVAAGLFLLSLISEGWRTTLFETWSSSILFWRWQIFFMLPAILILTAFSSSISIFPAPGDGARSIRVFRAQDHLLLEKEAIEKEDRIGSDAVRTLLFWPTFGETRHVLVVDGVGSANISIANFQSVDFDPRIATKSQELVLICPTDFLRLAAGGGRLTWNVAIDGVSLVKDLVYGGGFAWIGGVPDLEIPAGAFLCGASPDGQLRIDAAPSVTEPIPLHRPLTGGEKRVEVDIRGQGGGPYASCWIDLNELREKHWLRSSCRIEGLKTGDKCPCSVLASED